MMGVTPGFSGQKIDRHLYRRITALNKLKPKIKISVDGGLNVRNINKIIKLGVSELNLASYFDQPVSLTALIKQLRLTITK
jgi:pentose-5-phosphate-3-epimerase